MPISGMDTVIKISAMYINQENFWLYRDYALNSLTVDGLKHVQVETFNGKRLLLDNTLYSYHSVVLNNDNIHSFILDYNYISIAYSARAVNSEVMTEITNSTKKAAIYYAEKTRLLNIINNNLLDLEYKQNAINSYEILQYPVITFDIGVCSDYEIAFNETNQCTLSKWANGDYYDISLNLIGRKSTGV